jgi:hypothetical protein
MVTRIIEQSRERGTEVEIQDGFDLYKELAGIRRLYAENLPGYEIRGRFNYVCDC